MKGPWLWLLLFLSAATAQPRSGFEEMSPELQTMQKDDASNPAFLTITEGKQLAQACVDCHQDFSKSAVSFPKFHPRFNKPVTLEQQINLCVSERLAQTPSPKNTLALASFISLQSRGHTIEPTRDPRLIPFIAAGKEEFSRRQGQLNLSCANCHETLAGQKLASAYIPQGHTNGYPLYRLEWQAQGNLQRRLRNCYFGMRAQMPEDTTPLELFLKERGIGLTFESPAIRP